MELGRWLMKELGRYCRGVLGIRLFDVTQRLPFMEIKIGCKVSYPRELFEENHAERQMGVRKIEGEEWRQKGRSRRTRRTTLEMQSNRQMGEMM